MGAQRTVIRDGVPGYYDRLAYLFIDFNAFFASVEQLDDPALQGRPVIVTPLHSRKTSAIAVSYEARAYGIQRGTKVFEAEKLCPDLAIRPARHDRYVKVHHAIKEALEQVLPIEKVYSIDEMACPLAASEGDPERALAAAERVRAALLETFGPALRASIGLAQTRLLAKVAAERKKPNGLTVLQPSDLPHKLADVSLRSIPGIGQSMENNLARAGITSFPQLWALEPKQARRLWRSVQGERFWYALHGWETDEPDTEKSMIGHSRVLDRNHDTPEKARVVARALIMKAAARLRRYGYFASTVSLRLRIRSATSDRSAIDGQVSIQPTQDSFKLLTAFDTLWAEHLRTLIKDPDVRPPWRIGGVAIFLAGLVAENGPAAGQQELFVDPQAEAQRERQERLWKLIDAINSDPEGRIAELGLNKERGPAVGRYVTLAAQQNLDLNYLGGKIAFSRVPEDAEFVM